MQLALGFLDRPGTGERVHEAGTVFVHLLLCHPGGHGVLERDAPPFGCFREAPQELFSSRDLSRCACSHG
ncbi:MAG: hypothetical protein Tsb0013_01970 [Phycisphaerales bacterium]